MGKFREILSYLPETCPYLHFLMITSKCQGILTKLGVCIDIKIWFWSANGQISSIFDKFSACNMIMGGIIILCFYYQYI